MLKKRNVSFIWKGPKCQSVFLFQGRLSSQCLDELWELKRGPEGWYTRERVFSDQRACHADLWGHPLAPLASYNLLCRPAMLIGKAQVTSLPENTKSCYLELPSEQNLVPVWDHTALTKVSRCGVANWWRCSHSLTSKTATNNNNLIPKWAKDVFRRRYANGQ